MPRGMGRGSKYDAIQKVAQEDAMGCGLACVASVCGLSYARTKGTLFRNIGDIRRGFYCRELVRALARAGKAYRFHHVKNLPARNLPSDQSFLSAGQKLSRRPLSVKDC